MRPDLTAILPALALLLVVPAAGAQEKTSPPSKTWNFDSDKPEAPPVGFTFDRTGGGRVGRRVVLAKQDAPSGGQVLAQLDADTTSARFPVAVADEPAVRDLRLTVKCKPGVRKCRPGLRSRVSIPRRERRRSQFSCRFIHFHLDRNTSSRTTG